MEDVALACTPDLNGHCITCSDEALELQVLRVDPTLAMAWVASGSAEAEVDISLVADVIPGDTLLIHGGVALAKL